MPRRVLLPLIAGSAALAIMCWGQRVEWQCVGYDAGRPFWPCETPDFLLESIAAPAIVAGGLLSNLLWSDAPHHLYYAMQFPCILLWWWFVGTRIDFGLLGVGAYRHRRTYATLMALASAALLGLLAWSLWEEIQFHHRFPWAAGWGYLQLAADLRSLLGYLWLIALAVPLGVASFRVFQGRTGQTDKRLASPRTKRIAILGLVLYGLGVAGYCWHVRAVERQRQAEADRHSIMISGKVLDDRSLPVSGIEVDGVPLEDDQFQAIRKVYTWTDKNGDYTLRPENAGRYFVSVLWHAAPTAELPFLTRYYPDVPDQPHAAVLEITPALHLNLAPIRLRRLPLTEVPMSVSWSNGKPEPAATVLFSNTLYPWQLAIGNEARGIGESGSVWLPAGFDYKATAQVECDGGQKLSQPYTPEVAFSTKLTNPPIDRVRLVLPGEPCRVWHPK